LLGVTVEGCGKDLATAGGSRDRSDAISREVFEVEPPRNVTYEFLNVGGKKMSTSKGHGVAAHSIAEVLPPEQLRFLFLRPKPNQVIDFDPEGDTIPRLFDEFDRIAAATAGREVKGELPGDYERLFGYSLLGPDPDVSAAATAFRPPFGHLALLLQIPGTDIDARMAAEKGAPLTELEAGVLAERTSAARAWLESYAPERARLAIQRDAVPAEVAALGDDQKAYLAALAGAAAGDTPASGDAWQTLIFRVAAEADLASGRAFGALYAAFIGRSNGPRAGWLLAGLEPAFVVERLRAAAGD
jgi:lysyl-tRNA synthetase class 1